MGTDINSNSIFNKPYEGILREELLGKDKKSQIIMLE